MTTTFDNRERGYENKFAHDQETEFKILARTNYLLGQWAAVQMKLDEASTEAYAQDLLEISIQKNAAAVIQEKLQKDFANKGISISQQALDEERAKCLSAARTQILNAD